MSNFARLLVPAIRWDAATGFKGQRAHIEKAITLGCGGYIFFGGEAGAVRDLTAELRERTRHPLLIASDLERGAGQQFQGATGLPPLAAIHASGEPGAAQRCARITAREALSLGINWVVAPVCDLDVEKNNPIIGTRAFGSAPEVVSALAAEWIDACQGAGALACAKHFPGHGRTVSDSHAELPVVTADEDTLRAQDLAPFRAAIESGVASIITAHVAYPALDGSMRPATLSRPMLQGILREEMGFDGIIATDAMIMDGVLRGRGEERACVEALAAGCDLILYPTQLEAVADAVDEAVLRGELDAAQLARSLTRRDSWAEWASRTPPEGSSDGDRNWARSFAVSCVHEVRGRVSGIADHVDILIVDDDLGGPYPPPSREPFSKALQEAGIDVRLVEAFDVDPGRSALIALFGDIRSWKGRAGYGDRSLAAVGEAVRAETDAIVVQFSHPRLAGALPQGVHTVLSAWGGERVMQEAAAAWLAARAKSQSVRR